MTALAHASLEEKDSALKAAERATVLLPSSKDRVNGPAFEENLALIQAMFGETTLRDLNSNPAVTNAT